MITALIGAAAHGIGSFRIGCHAVPGQGRVVDGLGRFVSWIGGNRTIVASPWPGVQLETDLTDRIQRQMWAATYEPHVQACVDVILEPGAVYFDVGAHIGYHAVFAAHLVGPTGRVVAFEADPGIFERLAGNLSQFTYARAINAAVWECTTSIVFERSSTKNESGWGTVSTVRDSGKGEHVRVPAVALDSWCRDLRLDRLDAMKLDAEGSELAVLRGAESLLDKFRPVLVLEINPVLLEQGGNTPSDVARFLLERGYRLFRLAFRKLKDWDREKNLTFCEALCVPREALTAVLNRLEANGFKHA